MIQCLQTNSRPGLRHHLAPSGRQYNYYEKQLDGAPHMLKYRQCSHQNCTYIAVERHYKFRQWNIWSLGNIVGIQQSIVLLMLKVVCTNNFENTAMESPQWCSGYRAGLQSWRNWLESQAGHTVIDWAITSLAVYGENAIDKFPKNS